MSKNLSLTDGITRAARDLIYQAFEKGYKNGVLDTRADNLDNRADNYESSCEFCAYIDHEADDEPCVSCKHRYANMFFPMELVKEKEKVEATKCDRRIGQWERTPHNWYKCTACGEEVHVMPTCLGDPLFKYCPWCGADLQPERAER